LLGVTILSTAGLIITAIKAGGYNVGFACLFLGDFFLHEKYNKINPSCKEGFIDQFYNLD
jgi:hypothetical protein